MPMKQLNMLDFFQFDCEKRIPRHYRREESARDFTPAAQNGQIKTFRPRPMFENTEEALFSHLKGAQIDLSAGSPRESAKKHASRTHMTHKRSISSRPFLFEDNV